MRKCYPIASIVCGMFVFAFTYATDLTLKGRVVDEAGSPIFAASVTLKGSKTTTLADKNGEFTIKVSDKNSVLIITATGYEPLKPLL